MPYTYTQEVTQRHRALAKLATVPSIHFRRPESILFVAFQSAKAAHPHLVCTPISYRSYHFHFLNSRQGSDLRISEFVKATFET